MERLKPYAFLLLGGILYAQGFPNHLGFIFPLGPIMGTSILFYYLFKSEGLKLKVVYYLFYNSVINLHSFYWITRTLQEFGALPFPVAALINTLYAFVFNPHIWIFILLLTWIERKRGHWRQYFHKSGLINLSFATTLTLLEYYLPQQFPVMLGQPWIEFDGLLSLAPVLGLVGFSFISYLIVFETLQFIKARKFSLLNLIAIVLFFIATTVGFSTDLPKPHGKQFFVRLVQANISNFLKTDSEAGGFHSVSTVLDRYEKLSLADSEKKLELIIWPETAYPYPIHTDQDNILATQIPSIFGKIVFETNSAILFGGYDHFRDNDDGSYFKTEYNAALMINSLGQLETVYHKHVLIPFGETLPFGPLNKKISQIIPEMAFFMEGSRKSLFETENGLKYIVTICYEKLRPEFIRDYLNELKRRPDIMINLTNDSWYGNTLEPELHLFLARWRSAELKMPTLRSTNTGVSVYIDRFGQEVKRLEYEQTGNLDINLHSSDLAGEQAPTLFQIYGVFPLLGLILILFIFQGILLKYRHVKDTH